MDLLLRFHVSDGLIDSYWQGSPREMLVAQHPPDDPVYDALYVETELPPQTLLEEYYVVEGALVAKGVLTLTATPNPFPADGVAFSHVTVSPFVACTLRVDGTPLALTAADPTLELTSTAPHVFTVTLEPMAAYRADLLSVEAQ